MDINQAFQSIQAIQGNKGQLLDNAFLEDEGGKTLSFQNLFSQAVNGVNDTLMRSGDLSRKVVTGDVKNLHEVSIAGLKSELMLKLATQVTSKMTQAATQLFQMQI